MKALLTITYEKEIKEEEIQLLQEAVAERNMQLLGEVFEMDYRFKNMKLDIEEEK